MKIPVRKISIILVSLVGAVILWLHVLTERNYQMEANFNLKVVDMPQQYILAEKIPRYVRAKISGRGKDLFSQLVKGDEVLISAKHLSYGKKKIVLSEKNFKFTSPNIHLENVIFPKEITIHLDRKSQKKVSVVSRLVVIPAAGLIAKSSPKFEPPSVLVEGPETKISKISRVYTAPETLRGFNTSTSVIVPLDSPDENVRVVPDTVTAFIGVEQIAQRKIENVPVKLSGLSGKKGKIVPDKINVIITGAKSDVEKIRKSQIKAIVNYNDITEMGTEKIKPSVIVPQTIQVLATEPEYLKFTD
ncbi:hypothetical protein J7M00_06035 [bacterium]|nr:hypothetical protein [bacterium]